MALRLQFMLFVVGTLLVWSCAEEAEPFASEPSVKLRFFNIDSLNEVNGLIQEIDTSTKYLNLENSAINTQRRDLSDSLNQINELIAGGREDLDAAKSSVEAQINSLTGRQTEITSSLDSLSMKRSSFAKTASTIKAGKVWLRNIDANGQSLYFDDSATFFALPLNLNANTQLYYLELGHRRDSLEISYTLEEELTERSYIKLIGRNIQLTGLHSYDSVTLFCRSLPEPCSSDETTINIYF